MTDLPLTFQTEELELAISQLSPVARLELENRLLRNRLDSLSPPAPAAPEPKRPFSRPVE